MKVHTVVVAAAVWFATLACDGGTMAPRELAVPGQLLLVGEAQGTAPGGQSIHCFLDIVLQLEESERTTSGTTYVGTHGGHVGRALLDDEGAGFSFDAFVGGEARVEIRLPDRLDVVFPANENVESRFWASLHVLDGSFEAGPETTEGTWSCQPLDLTQGYVDTAGVAEGSWRLETP